MIIKFKKKFPLLKNIILKDAEMLNLKLKNRKYKFRRKKELNIISSSNKLEWTESQIIDTARLLGFRKCKPTKLYKIIFSKRQQLIEKFIFQYMIRKLSLPTELGSNNSNSSMVINECDCVSGLGINQTPILWRFFTMESSQLYFFDIRTLNSLKELKNPYTNIKFTKRDIKRFRKITKLLKKIGISTNFLNADPMEKLLFKIALLVKQLNFNFDIHWFTELSDDNIRYLYRLYRGYFWSISLGDEGRLEITTKRLWTLNNLLDITIDVIKKDLLQNIIVMLSESNDTDVLIRSALTFLVNLEYVNPRIRISI